MDFFLLKKKKTFTMDLGGRLDLNLAQTMRPTLPQIMHR